MFSNQWRELQLLLTMSTETSEETVEDIVEDIVEDTSPPPADTLEAAPPRSLSAAPRDTAAAARTRAASST